MANRTQQVKIGGQSSEKCEVKSGVPQGTVLGPPLFKVFIDDLDDYAVLIELLIGFADDTKGFKEINGLEDRKSLQETLDNLYEWARIWVMSFNVKKMFCMNHGVGKTKKEIIVFCFCDLFIYPSILYSFIHNFEEKKFASSLKKRRKEARLP